MIMDLSDTPRPFFIWHNHIEKVQTTAGAVFLNGTAAGSGMSGLWGWTHARPGKGFSFYLQPAVAGGQLQAGGNRGLSSAYPKRLSWWSS